MNSFTKICYNNKWIMEIYSKLNKSFLNLEKESKDDLIFLLLEKDLIVD